MKDFLVAIAPWTLLAIFAVGSAWVLFDLLKDSWKEFISNLDDKKGKGD